MKSIKKATQWFDSKRVITAFLLLFIASAILYADRNFLTTITMTNLLTKTTINGGFLAIGMTFVLLIGAIDLSVGSVLAIAGVLAAYLAPVGPAVAIPAALLCAVAIGFINGLLVTKMKIVPFIATLATMLGVRGIVFIITNKKSISVQDNGVLSAIANSDALILPIPVWILFISVLLCMHLSRNTRTGMALYAVGGNEDAAKMMGLRVDRIKITAYVYCALFAGINGVLLASRLNAGQAVAGTGWEMTAIASAVLGGVKMSGGSGKFSGTFFGILIIGIINTIFNYQGNINTWWQNVIMGTILLVAVILQSDKIKINSKAKV